MGYSRIETLFSIASWNCCVAHGWDLENFRWFMLMYFMYLDLASFQKCMVLRCPQCLGKNMETTLFSHWVVTGSAIKFLYIKHPKILELHVAMLFVNSLFTSPWPHASHNCTIAFQETKAEECWIQVIVNTYWFTLIAQYCTCHSNYKQSIVIAQTEA